MMFEDAIKQIGKRIAFTISGVRATEKSQIKLNKFYLNKLR